MAFVQQVKDYATNSIIVDVVDCFYRLFIMISTDGFPLSTLCVKTTVYLLGLLEQSAVSQKLNLEMLNVALPHALSNSYLSELLHLYSPSRSLRSSSDTPMLKIQRFNRKTHGFRTFSHFGPHIWNNLPQDIRHSATLSSFKSQLKTFLFSEYFS